MSLQKLTHTYQLKRGKEDTLFKQNPLLERGEPIVIYFNDGTTGLKIGDGINAYNDLPLISGKASEIDFSQIEYLTFNEYTQLTSLEEKILYVCTDTQQIFVGTNELTKSSYILEEIPTDETIGNNGSLYYCKKDLSLYLCNKVEDSYIWTIVASMDANGLKITENGKEDVAITINLDSIDESVKLKNINIKNANIEGNNIDKLGCIYTTNKNLYGGDFTTLPILSQLVPEFILDTMQFFNNELKINHQKVIEYLENNTNVEQEIIYDEELGMYKYLLMSMKMPENPTDGELIVADMKMFITEDCRLKLEGFMFNEEPEDFETLLESEFTIPVCVFGTPPVADNIPATDGDNDTFRLYFTNMTQMIPAINFGFDFNFNGQNINDTTSYYQMKKLFDIDNSSDDKVIDIRLNDSSYLLTFDMVNQEVIKVKSEYEKLVEAGIKDIDESLTNTYKITYNDFKTNYYVIALILKGDLIYGNKPEDEPEEFERTSNVVLNGTKLFLEKLPYETVTEILKINGTDLSDDEKSAIIIDKTGRVTAAEGFQVPSEYLSGFELTYKYKKNYTNSFATHNYAIQIDDNEFITQCNKLYASEICKQLLPEALTEDNEFIEDMLVNDEITLQASGEGNNYVLLSNIESEYEAKVSLTNKLNNSSSGSTSKVSVKEELDKIIKLTGTVDMSTVFKPGYYLVEADKILNGPPIDIFDDNNTTINNKEIVINAGGNEFIFNTPSSIFMEVTEYPFNNIGYITTLITDDGVIEAVNYLYSVRLKLPLHTYILNRVICKPVDNYDTRVIHPDYDYINSGAHNQINGWYVDDVVSGTPNITLKDNNYISLEEPVFYDSSDLLYLSTLLPHHNTKVLDTSKLEILLDNLEKTTDTYVNVPTSGDSNYIYIPQYVVSNNHSAVLFKRSKLSDIPSNGHESCRLDLSRFVKVLNNINTYYYIDEITGSLYYTTDFKFFQKVFDFSDITIDEDLFKKVLNKDSDTQLGITSYDYYKNYFMTLIKATLIDQRFIVDCVNSYYSPTIYLNNGNQIFAVIYNRKIYLLPEGFDCIDSAIFTTITKSFYNRENWQTEYVTMPIITYCDGGEIKCWNLLENEEITLFKLNNTYNNVTSFLNSNNIYDKDYTVIATLCNDNNLGTTDFTETTFRVNLNSIINSVYYSDDNYQRPYWHITEPYNETNYPSSIIKSIQTIDDYVDLTDEEKQNLIYMLSSGNINKLKCYGGYVDYKSVSTTGKNSKSIYNAVIDVYTVDSSNSHKYTHIYVIDNIIIFKNADGTYHKVVRANDVIKWINITDNDNIYAGSDTQQYLHIYENNVGVPMIDTSIKPIRYNIYDSYLLGNMDNLNIRYIPYRVDYIEPNGQTFNFKGELGKYSSTGYPIDTFLTNNSVNKFILSPSGCINKDNNLVKYEDIPKVIKCTNPMFNPSLDLTIGYGDWYANSSSIILNKDDLIMTKDTTIDLLTGEIKNLKKKIPITEKLGISKEQYIELVNSISSIYSDSVNWSGYGYQFYFTATVPDTYNVNINTSDPISTTHNVQLINGGSMYNKPDGLSHCEGDSELNRLYIQKLSTGSIRFWLVQNHLGINSNSEEYLTPFKQLFLSLVDEGKEAQFYEDYTSTVYLPTIPFTMKYISAVTNNVVTFNYDINVIGDKDIIKQDLIAYSGNWVEDTTFVEQGYNYHNDISLNDCSKDFDRVYDLVYTDIKNNITDNLSNFAIINENSKITIYAKEKPTENVNIRYVKITHR